MTEQTSPDPQQVEQAAAITAGETAKQAQSGDITPQTLVDLITGIPDKIVEAMKESYPAPQQQQQQQQQLAKEPFSLNKWWFGS